MPTRQDLTGHPGGPLHAALLAYAQSPGKYPVALRQPPVLFASVREIVQLATGRGSSATPDSGPDKVAVQKAACFFVKTALLFPGADHYALLGLDRSADTAALKDRYRLLMRLIHPDFSGGVSSHWPADAAVRVNMAYEVLSSVLRRRDYDADLARATVRPTAAKPPPQRIHPPQRAPTHGISRTGYNRLIVTCGVAGALVLIGLFASGREGVQLVQRKTPTEPPAVVVTQQAIATIAPPAPPAPPLQTAAPMRAQDKPRPAATSLAAKVAVSPTAAPVARTSLAAPPAPAPVVPPARPVPPTVIAAAPVRVEPPAPVVAAAPIPAVVPVPVAAPTAPPTAPVVALSTLPPVPQARPARPAPIPGLSLAEAQPLLSVLLQQLESGRGERLINMLDREARNQPSAQALSRHYDSLIDGMKPVRLSQVEFRAEPADGRLFVVGNIGLQLGDQAGAVSKRMTVRAEFVSRDGSVVMTGLSGGHGN